MKRKTDFQKKIFLQQNNGKKKREQGEEKVKNIQILKIENR